MSKTHHLTSPFSEEVIRSLHAGDIVYFDGPLFGIRGARWDAVASYRKLYNEFWIRPGEKSKPVYYQKVDGGCYW